MYSSGMPACRMLWSIRLTTTLGNAALTSRNNIDMKGSAKAQASVVNFMSRCSESVIDFPGRPPKWVGGRRL